jgi:hypothetical protein
VTALAAYDRRHGKVVTHREVGPIRARLGLAAARRAPTAVDLVIEVDGVPMVVCPDGLAVRRR